MLSYQSAKSLLLKPLAEGGFFDVATGLILQNDRGNPAGQGDAVWRTSLACIAMAIEGDGGKAVSFLEAIDRHCWDNSGNPIRYPGLDDFSKDGRNLGPQPLTIDGFIPLMAACYLTWELGYLGGNRGVWQPALALMRRYNDYLTVRQWRLQTKYSDDEINNNIRRSGDKSVGPESFMLLPPNIYAFKVSLGRMDGLVFSETAPSLDTGAEIIQLAADYMAYFYGIKVLKPILEFIRIGFHWDIRLPGGWADSLAIKGSVEAGLPKEVVNEVVSTFQNGFREAVRARVLTKLQPLDLIILALKKALQAVPLPEPLDFDSWAGVISEAMALVNVQKLNILPMTSELLDYVILLKYQDIYGHKDDPKNFYSVHLAFWPLLLMLKIDFYIDFLQPAVSSFYDSIKQHRMGLFAWLAQDNQTVAQLLKDFETNESFKKIDYMWQETRVGQEAEENRPVGILSPRIDYMLLYQLNGSQRPPQINISYPFIEDQVSKSCKMLLEKYVRNVRATAIGENGFTRKVKDEVGNIFEQIWRNEQFIEHYIGKAAEHHFGKIAKEGENVFNKMSKVQLVKVACKDGKIISRLFDDLRKKVDESAADILEIGEEGLEKIQRRFSILNNDLIKNEVFDRAAAEIFNNANYFMELTARVNNLIQKQVVKFLNGDDTEALFHDAAKEIDPMARSIVLHRINGIVRQELIDHLNGSSVVRAYDENRKLLGEKIIQGGQIIKDTLGSIADSLPSIKLPDIHIPPINWPHWLVSALLSP